jgi:putative transport protein
VLRDFLQQRPLLLLFAVAALGYLLGRLNWRGFSLGVAAVLFAGLGVGWLLPGADLPAFVPELGLVLFVYTVGVASGPGFFASLRLRGLRDNALVLGVVLLSGLLTFCLARGFGLSAATAAGLFSGALTNAPALAAVVQSLKSAGMSGAALSEPVLACSLCYPLGVLLPLLVVAASPRCFHVDYAKEHVSHAYGGEGAGEPITMATVSIAAPALGPAASLRRTADYSVNFGRIRRGGVTSVVHDETQFSRGDLVTVIGTEDNVANAVDALGRRSKTHLEYDRSEVDFRRIFVSNADVTERPLKALHLMQRFDAVITRVRRGDIDLVPDADFELLLGDRVRVLAAKSELPKLEKLFGDSVRRLSEIDVITFGLGITAGLLLGAIQVPLPGHDTFSLGLAGGPLVMGLCLGRAGRTGPLVWTPAYGVNLTLRQFGLVLFLAGVGLQAGSQLAGTLADGALLSTVAAGALVTLVSALTTMLIGYHFLRIPLSVLVGTVAGLQTQPAVLAYALDKTGRDTPNVGYTTVFPLAMIAKIMLAQGLLQLIR